MMSVYQTTKAEAVKDKDKKDNQDKQQGMSSQTSGNSSEQGQGEDTSLVQLRQTVVAIAHRLGQADNVESLLQVAVEQLQEKLECDRALIYRFESQDQGRVLAEAKNRGWTPANGETLPATTFGFDSQAEYLDQTLVVLDRQQPLTPYQEQLLDRFQVKSGISVPIIIANQLWGLLIVHQCGNGREWTESEKLVLEQISIQLTLSLQQSEFEQQFKALEAREQSLAKVIEKIRRSLDQETIFKNLAQEVRNFMDADRVGVYKFNEDWSGQFIEESVGANWTRLVGPGIKTVWEDTYLQETQGGRYRYHEFFAVDDIYKAGHSPCHVDILEQFEVRAYLITPIFVGEKLWGLLGVYQNDGPRHWTEREIADMERIASQLWEVLQQANNLQQVKKQSLQLEEAANRDRAISKVINRIRQSLDLDTIFRTTTQEVRSLINCDRVAVFRFNPDWSGVFVSESVAPGWVSIVEKQYEIDRLQESIRDCDNVQAVVQGKDKMLRAEMPNRQMLLDDVMKATQGGQNLGNGMFIRDNIYEAGFDPCYIEVLEEYQAKAYVIVPIYRGNKLWGMLAAYQNDSPRHWETTEVSLLQQISDQLGVALKQAESLQEIENKSQQLAEAAERDRAISKVIDRIRQSLDLESIFRTTTQEVRSLIKSDRVAVFRFNPDWSGVFVSESVAPGWVSLIEKQYEIDRLQESIRDCDNVQAVVQGKDKMLRAEMPNRQMLMDDVMKETQGGQNLGSGMFIRDNIYEAGFDPCYVEVLEEYQAQAYAIVPIYRGNKLWGMLAAYQNDGPRHWEVTEINLLQQIANQLGVALQQAEYLQEIEAKSKQLQEAAERDRAVSKVIDRIRQSLDIQAIFRTTTQEVRSLLDTDRVAVYRFNPDWSGVFVSESTGKGWVSLVERQEQIDRLKESVSDCGPMRKLINESKNPASDSGSLNFPMTDTYIQQTKGGGRRTYVQDDIYKAGFSPCYIEVLEEYQTRAYAIVPIFQGEKLWGMLAAYQNDGPRHWEEVEVDLLTRIASQLGVALQQAEYLNEIQSKSQQLAEAAEREKEAKETLQQRAALLLRAVRPALDGDLTVRAPVTEDEVGTIADAYNNTLQSLRRLVVQVQQAAEQVASTSNRSDSAIIGLTDLAQTQSQDISEALDKIEQMVNSTNAVASNAKQVEEAVQRANQTVETGDTAMNRTVDSIQVIRDTVAQTAKKIKSLSESSQKISKAVNLIGNFATQTNVLALNAAIEATRAGEYGKGFAVVAEEVRSLSRQSAEATKEIEELVKEIQEGTGEVAASMETGIQQVVEGTNLVSDTRESLNEIVASTTQISQLVESITQATQVQTQQSELVTKVMTEVASVANQTAGESTQMSASFKELLGMAQELTASAGKFKVN